MGGVYMKPLLHYGLPVLIVLTIIIAWFFIGFKGEPREKDEFKKEVEQFLKGKYPETEMVVRNVAHSFKENQYFATVCLQEQELSFIVKRYEGKKINQPFIDTYKEMLWEKEVNSKLDSYAKEVYKKELFSTKVELNSDIELENLLKEKVPSFDELQFKDKLSISAYISISSDFNENSVVQNEEMELINKFIEKLGVRVNRLKFIYGGDENRTYKP